MEIRRDTDPAETAEWREALASVLAFEADRGSFLLGELMAEAQRMLAS
jgi:pyruvate dehydrogenase complex dehydrogenase (E1) component